LWSKAAILRACMPQARCCVCWVGECLCRPATQGVPLHRDGRYLIWIFLIHCALVALSDRHMTQNRYQKRELWEEVPVC
jgi:hypothetical protein